MLLNSRCALIVAIYAGVFLPSAAGAENTCNSPFIMGCVPYEELPNYLQIDSVQVISDYGINTVTDLCRKIDTSGQCESRAAFAAMAIDTAWKKTQESFLPSPFVFSSYSKDQVKNWDEFYNQIVGRIGREAFEDQYLIRTVSRTLEACGLRTADDLVRPIQRAAQKLPQFEQTINSGRLADRGELEAYFRELGESHLYIRQNERRTECALVAYVETKPDNPEHLYQRYAELIEQNLTNAIAIERSTVNELNTENQEAIEELEQTLATVEREKRRLEGIQSNLGMRLTSARQQLNTQRDLSADAFEEYVYTKSAVYGMQLACGMNPDVDGLSQEIYSNPHGLNAANLDIAASLTMATFGTIQDSGGSSYSCSELGDF